MNRLSRLVIQSAKKANSLSGSRLSQSNTLRTLYRKTLFLTGYLDENRDIDLERHSFGNYELFLDDSERHQQNLLAGNNQNELDVFSDIIEGDDVVYDLGANIGSFSISAAANHPQATFVAVEPEPRTFNHLVKNVELNGLSDRVDCKQMVVSDIGGEASLNISASSNQATHSLVKTTHHGTESITVDKTTLDAISSTFPDPDVIKIDVEGAEKNVLEGGSRTLGGEPTILIDIHGSELRKFGESPTGVCESLTAYGELFEVSPDGLAPANDISSLSYPTTLLVKPD